MPAHHINIIDLVEGYIGNGDWRVKENANIGYSFGGLMLHISGSINARYVLEKIYTKEIAEAHQSGDGKGYRL